MSEPFRIFFREPGGPDVLERQALDNLIPGVGELLVRHTAVGLNFLDTYQRSGLYTVPLPSGVGSEAAGVVEAVGPEVKGFTAGDRIGYFLGPLGAYATHRLIDARRVVKLPETISAETAAATMLKGCTAEFLVERCARIQPGHSVLVHAAAGGVGSILVPWLKAIGAIVIAHAGTEAKAAMARELGADHALWCPMETLTAEVRALTGGHGVTFVYDAIGAASWQASLGAIAKRGMLISYGNASGPVPPFSAIDLLRAGSIYVTRPSLFDYCASEEEMRASAARLFGMLEAGTIAPRIGARYPLAEAAEAHRALEARETTGSTLLIP